MTDRLGAGRWNHNLHYHSVLDSVYGILRVDSTVRRGAATASAAAPDNPMALISAASRTS